MQATGYTIDYFLYNNDRVEDIPLTTPLIWRPDPAGTWIASFALPPSMFRTVASAPGPTLPSTELEYFSNKRVAAFGFYSIELAVQGDYEAACTSLATWIQAQGLTPVPGDWQEAWVTYNTESQVGLRFNECWAEIPSN